MIKKRKILFIIGITAILILSGCNLPSATPAPDASSSSEGVSEASPEVILDACTNPYFPVINGATWNYTSTGGIGGDFSHTASISEVADTSFMMNDVFSTGTLANVQWNCEDGNLGALNTGQSGAVGASGVTTEINSASASGYTIPASFAEGQTWTNVILMNASTYMNGEEQATADSQTSYDCSYSGTAAITVPAGTFNTVYYKCSIINTTTVTIDGVDYGPIDTVWDSTTWLAEGVGIVQIINEGDSGDEMVVLTSYSIP